MSRTEWHHIARRARLSGIDRRTRESEHPADSLQPIRLAGASGDRDLAQKLVVGRTIGEVPMTAQHQRLIDGFPQIAVRRLNATILVT